MGGSSGKPGKGGYKGRKTQPPAGIAVGGGGLGGGIGTDPCSIDTMVSLASPVPAVVSGLATGQILTVVLNTAGVNPIAEVHNQNGQVAGTLAGIPHLRDIIDCMLRNVGYVVEVTGINGGRVDGNLRNA